MERTHAEREHTAVGGDAPAPSVRRAAAQSRTGILAAVASVDENFRHATREGSRIRATTSSEGPVIRRRVDQTFAQHAATRPATDTMLQKASGYFTLIKGELAKLDKGRAAGAQALFKAAQDEGKRLAGANPSDAEMQTYVTDFLQPLVDEVNGVFDAIAAEQQPAQAAPVEQEWTYRTADLTAKKPKGADSDLDDMIKRCSATLHQSKQKTLIGGFSVKSKTCSKIALVNSSGRIDVQNSPGKGLYNVQYQIGDNSYGNVVFADEDSDPMALRYLRESFGRTQKAISPAATKLGAT